HATPPGGTAAARSTTPTGGRDAGRGLHERLHEQERAEIIAAIEQAQGNIALASRTLGINRSTLYYRLRKHGLEHLLPLKESPAAPSPGNGERASGEPVPNPNTGAEPGSQSE
ncbi:MAG TPA: helix-turn-helix domain-containing protein, partial [Polyangia bacterium]|nr:helix-turn-helix domain-containing protein [Polyangia bacterium]